ncbi:MAG: glycoside hydrolase family 5 protein [Planctomycetota bacterium]
MSTFTKKTDIVNKKSIDTCDLHVWRRFFTKKSLVILSLLVFTGIEFAGVAQGAIPWLHVDGNAIKDPNGNVVVLRGVALEDLGCVQLWRDGYENRIDRLTDMTDSQGASTGWYTRVVRLAVYPSDQGDGGYPWYFDDDPNDYYDNLLRPAVDYCALKGLYVIIDWHYITDTWDKVAQTSAFWEYIAPRFAGDSHVLFELFNEPMNDGASETARWLSVRTDMQTWVDIVRTYAANNLILVGGPSWSQMIGPAATYPVSGSNIVYVSHIYPAHWLSIYGSQAWFKSQITTCAAVHPVIMTEWGFSMSMGENTLLNGTITNYGQPLMDFIEQHGISNTAWCADYAWGPPMFWGDWTLRCGDGEMGCFVKDTLYWRRNDDQPNPGIIDFTEYAGFASQWSRTDCNSGNGFCDGADTDESGEVAGLDLKEWVDQWLKTGPSYLTTSVATVSGDGLGNMADFAIFADNWLAGL